jgi:cold shock protein
LPFKHLPRFAAHDLPGGNTWQLELSNGSRTTRASVSSRPMTRAKDLFVHHLSIAGSGFKSLAEGAKVSYDVEQGPKGLAAANVHPI